MGSLRALNVLLFLLVLVPAGVLGWLGFRTARLWEREAAIRLRRDLDYEEGTVLARGATAGRRFDAEVEQAVGAAAKAVRDSLPFVGTAAAMAKAEQQLRATLPSATVKTEGAPRVWRFHGLVDLRLVDAAGRSLHPPEHRPLDGPPGGPAWHALLHDLRRRADRLRFGPVPDVDGAIALWKDARARMPTPELRAVADVERALVAVDAGRTDAGAEERALASRWSPNVLERVGRPLARLRLTATERSPASRAGPPTSDLDRWLATTPLTPEERRRARAQVAALVADLPPEDPRTWPAWDRAPTFEVSAEVAEGARLVAMLSESWAWDEFARRVRRFLSPSRSVTADARRPENVHPGLGPSHPGAVGRELYESQRELHGPGWGGRRAGYVLVHREADTFRREAESRRRWTFLGIGALLLLMVVGQVLVGRAVRRERAARRLRDDFIANVSHELRTPLTSVCFHAEMLADEDPPPERRRHLATVVRAEGARLAGLVDDLLDFSALERGTRRLEIGPVDLAAAARAAADPYVVLAGQEGATIEIEDAAEEVSALADPGVLSRILTNLLANAWRHGRPSRDGGPGRIRVRVTRGATPGVEVRDDGPGIPTAEREAVFERFRRGRTTERVDGAGLGLALGRELARAMGGDLAIVDHREETVFRLTLPPVPVVDEA